jgi:hypothetical protein
MMDWSYHINNPMCAFEIVKQLGETSRGVHLHVQTEKGTMPVWIPKKIASIYHYMDGNRAVREIQLPEWFAQKTGLI